MEEVPLVPVVVFVPMPDGGVNAVDDATIYGAVVEQHQLLPNQILYCRVMGQDKEEVLLSVRFTE